MLIQSLAAVGVTGAAAVENAQLIEQWQEESPLPPVDLLPGDLLVVHLGIRLTKERLRDIKSCFEAQLPGVKVVVVQNLIQGDFSAISGNPLDRSTLPARDEPSCKMPVFQFQRMRMGTAEAD